MYRASSTKVNAEQAMCLYGAAAYAGCPERMLATDGQLTKEAHVVAVGLNVAVRLIPAQSASPGPKDAISSKTVSFGVIWRDHIEPLAGTELARENGKTMQILDVDGGGVRRITTGGTPQRIRIDIFRWTVDRLLAGEPSCAERSTSGIPARSPRLIWQLADAAELLVAWHPLSNDGKPRDLEKLLLECFADLHRGRRPLANLTG